MRVIIITNHFQYQDGVCRAAIGMANALAKREEFDVTLCPLFIFDRNMLSDLDERVVLKPLFKTYFRGFQRIVDLIPKIWLHKLVIGENYDIEIGYCMRMPIQLVAAAVRRKARRKDKRRYFAWMHGYDEGLSLRKEYAKIGRVICVSKQNAERLKKESNGQFSVDYAHNIVDEKAIIKLGNEAIPIARPKGVLFCSVGRFTHEKGYIRLIRIVKRLNDAGYVFHLWLIGNGPEIIDVESEIVKLGIKNVKLLGEQDNPHAYTAKSDLFICSSYSEGYSTACTEAVMLGVPIISTEVSGAHEIIEDSNAGIVVDNNDDALYEGLRRILDDDMILSTWRKDIKREEFSASSRIQRIIDIISR